MPNPAPTARTRVVRLPDRARYGRAEIDAILDEGLIAHAGFVHDGGPVVIPVAYGRDGDRLYLHGATSARFVRSMRDAEVCLTVTLLDGLVLARSAFHHSMNYRSVVIFGEALEVDDPAQRERALACLVDHIVPGRTRDARAASARELRATAILAIGLDEASAKLRTGDPKDDDEDLALPVWAGVIPVATSFGRPLPDRLVPPDVATPGYVREYARPGTRG